MILWFGKKKKKKKLEDAGAAMDAPELSADELAAREAVAHEEADTATEAVDHAQEDEVARQQEAAAAEQRRLEEEHEAERRAEAAREAEEAERQREAAAKAQEEALRPQDTDTAEDSRPAGTDDAPGTADAADPYQETKSPGFLKKLSGGLSKSSSKLGSSLTGVFNKRKLDDEALEDLEDLLITSDLGAKVAGKVTASLAKSRFDKDVTDAEIKAALAEEIEKIMTPREKVVDFSDGPRPRIVLFVGVNGSGKTTTIGKIASKLKDQGAKALLVAGDTFRAAAIEQLTVWGERAGIPVMSRPTGADAASLVYEAVERARAENLDLVLVDTAGRLQNKAELMSELAKIVRVTRKLDPDAPHDVILVLDATVGQNALSQVEAFRHTAEVSGIVMTKLDGTAKGGVLVAVAEAHDLPIHFIGVGEKAEDLQPFSARAYAHALVGIEEEETA
ncbi:signal recognition particle-docking protein FtsY [Henriciella sp.]|uniref:signal recognition particle-docking protein FtsY n=1 Tax=Henriciella sp. TaxID=1968823 RepID=UPI0026327F64|nr:signal recognition particle-docking protein FtsY [Henriciella sp.]